MQLINPANAVFHRIGGLGLTTRFGENEVPIITDDDWKDGSSTVNITFSSGEGMRSSAVVREFVPRYGDVTGRRYTDKRGNHHWVNLPSYALVDPLAYGNLIRQQIPAQALGWAALQSPSHLEALRLIQAGVAPELETLLQYDFGRYQKTRSAFMIGSAHIGVEALPEDAQAMPGRYPLPRMVTAQGDIILTMYLGELLEKLFGDSDGPFVKRLSSTDSMDTHVAYVALRILVQGTIWILVDKERRDWQNNNHDYSLQVQLQESLNGIIHVFSSKRLGLDYRSLEGGIPLEAAMVYSSIYQQPDGMPVTSWKSPLFWLPTLYDIVTKPFQPRIVFRV